MRYLHHLREDGFREYRGPKAAPATRASQESLRNAKTLMKLLGFDKDWQKRLAACVEETHVPARCLIRQSVQAVIESVEANGYVVLPVKFSIKQ